MPINFVPERGRILICDYDLARIPPEMEKQRRVVVISPRTYNVRHGALAGRCIVVPFSATDPGKFITPADVPFRAGAYWSLTIKTWAICSAVMSVSHDRLDRVYANGRHQNELLSAADIVRVEEGLRRAMGFP